MRSLKKDSEEGGEKKARLVFATGVSGCGRKEYLKKFIDYSEKRGKKVKVYHTGEMMLNHARELGINITKKNVHNSDQAAITCLRSAVFQMILRSLPKDMEEYDAVIINAHAVFFWKKSFVIALDPYYEKRIVPDFYVTFIDNSKCICGRLVRRKQFRGIAPGQEEVLFWQNCEYNHTEHLAMWHEKPHYTLAVQQPESTLHKLLFYPDAEMIYASMPMTHLKKQESRDMITAFVEKLNDYFIVFDPRTVEIDTPDGSGNAEEAISFQTVVRDNKWLIRKQSAMLIGFMPEVVPSPGMHHEMHEAIESNKEVLLVFPNAGKSPFLIYYASQVFKNEEEFFEYLEKNGYKPIFRE